jgi:DNA replication protein DnaC
MDSPSDLYGHNPHMAPSRSRDSACPFAVCDGSGFVLREEDDVAVPCRCRAQRVARARTSRLASQIPRRYRGVAFDRRPVIDIDPYFVREVRHFCNRIDDHLDSGDSIGFFGDRGTGKTTLAMLISIEAMRAERTVAVYTGPDLLTAIRSTYDDNSYTALMESLVAVDLLHIDDLSVARPTEWVLEQLYAIVNERWQDGRSIVVTTNITDIDQLRAQIGLRTVSRLSGICDEPLMIMGPDLRTAGNWG